MAWEFSSWQGILSAWIFQNMPMSFDLTGRFDSRHISTMSELAWFVAHVRPRREKNCSNSANREEFQ